MLLEAYSANPVAGHRKVSIEQIQHADMELFKKLIKDTRDGIRPSGGAVPVQIALRAAITAPEIRLHLQPLPSGAATKRSSAEGDDSPIQPVSKKAKNNEVEKMRRTIENLQGQVRNLRSTPSSRPKGKGKGGGKIAAPHGSVRMPPELIGQSATNAEGEPICFSFNLNGCKGAKAGQRCSKGWHMCTKPGCEGHHSQRDHK